MKNKLTTPESANLFGLILMMMVISIFVLSLLLNNSADTAIKPSSIDSLIITNKQLLNENRILRNKIYNLESIAKELDIYKKYKGVK